MKKIYTILLMIVLVTGLTAFDKYAGEIYDLTSGVRNIAMGNTGLTDVKTFSPAYWNSALIPEIGESRVELMHATEFDGLFKYDNISLFWNSQNPVAINLTRISINDIPLTKLEDESAEISNNNRPYAYKYVDNNDYLLSIGLSRSLNSKLNIGLTPKITYRDVAEESGWALGADISLLYKAKTNLLLAGKIDNVVATHVLWENGTYETVSPKADLEARFLFTMFKREIPFELALRTEFFMLEDSDIGEYDLSITSINPHIGLSVTPFSNLSFLAGYDTNSLTAGVDLVYNNFTIFYAYSNSNESDLGSSQKIALGYNF
ncbi:MAG: hypothetical protein B6226_00445 [Candidatus Cloacimonetes bacterium 4572_65]|nr:MAG: hypothetical protein B6226_00445 [Candidatus Cloacimonetes bacterium 4572_65]